MVFRFLRILHDAMPMLFLLMIIMTNSQHLSMGIEIARESSLMSVIQHESVLAFGDSLTRGACRYTGKKVFFHPYTLVLGELLSNYSVNVTNFGVSGDTAANMVRRLPWQLEQLTLKNNTPKFVIILAGTNDLTKIPVTGETVEDIIADVVRLHDIVQIHAAYSNRTIFTIAIAVPQYHLGFKTQQLRRRLLSPAVTEPTVEHLEHGREELRLLINKHLKEYAEQSRPLHCRNSRSISSSAESAGDGRVGRVMFVDFTSEFDQTAPGAQVFWSDDWLHYTERAYDRMGLLLYQTMERFADQIAHDTKDPCPL